MESFPLDSEADLILALPTEPSPYPVAGYVDPQPEHQLDGIKKPPDSPPQKKADIGPFQTHTCTLEQFSSIATVPIANPDQHVPVAISAALQKQGTAVSRPVHRDHSGSGLATIPHLKSQKKAQKLISGASSRISKHSSHITDQLCFTPLLLDNAFKVAQAQAKKGQRHLSNVEIMCGGAYSSSTNSAAAPTEYIACKQMDQIPIWMQKNHAYSAATGYFNVSPKNAAEKAADAGAVVDIVAPPSVISLAASPGDWQIQSAQNPKTVYGIANPFLTCPKTDFGIGNKLDFLNGGLIPPPSGDSSPQISAFTLPSSHQFLDEPLQGKISFNSNPLNNFSYCSITAEPLRNYLNPAAPNQMAAPDAILMGWESNKQSPKSYQPRDDHDDDCTEASTSCHGTPNSLQNSIQSRVGNLRFATNSPRALHKPNATVDQLDAGLSNASEQLPSCSPQTAEAEFLHALSHDCNRNGSSLHIQSRIAHQLPSNSAQKKRTRLSAWQLLQLDKAFKEIQTPKGAVRMSLALHIGIPEKSVQIWFQNKRAKIRRMYSANQYSPILHDIGVPHFLANEIRPATNQPVGMIPASNNSAPTDYRSFSPQYEFRLPSFSPMEGVVSVGGCGTLGVELGFGADLGASASMCGHAGCFPACCPPITAQPCYNLIPPDKLGLHPAAFTTGQQQHEIAIPPILPINQTKYGDDALSFLVVELNARTLPGCQVLEPGCRLLPMDQLRIGGWVGWPFRNPGFVACFYTLSRRSLTWMVHERCQVTKIDISFDQIRELSLNPEGMVLVLNSLPTIWAKSHSAYEVTEAQISNGWRQVTAVILDMLRHVVQAPYSTLAPHYSNIQLWR